jgi:outer membrane protein assembly factor BamE
MLKFFILIGFLLGGCAVYKIDVQQGTLMTQTLLDQLEYGMSKRKVSFVLGSPSVQDIFHENRWDYVYTLQKGGGKREQRHVVLFFEQDQLVQVAGDVKVGDRKKPAKLDKKLLEEPIL